MAIINRLARLFKADLHAVLDHIEEPELQLKQAIREMDEQLQITKSDIRHLKSQVKELSNRKAEANEFLNKTNNEITVCFENNNDSLAKGLIRRKLETNAMIQSLSIELDNTEQRVKSLQKESDEFSTHLSNMQQKAALMTSQASSSNSYDESFLQVNDNDVEVALLQEKQRFETQSKVS